MPKGEKKESRTFSDDDVRKLVLGQMKASGFSFQSKIARRVQKYFDSVHQEVSYLDKDTNEGRKIDINAVKFIPDLSKLDQNKRHVIGQLRLIIECKNLPGHAWIFFKGEKESINLPESESITNWNVDPFNAFIPITPFPDTFAATGYDEYVFDKNKSNKKVTNLYAAINEVTKATRYDMEQMDTTSRTVAAHFSTVKTRIVAFEIFQPVIVFSGRMFQVIDDLDEPKIEKVDCVQIPKDYVSGKYEEVLGDIHIVSDNYLDEYLEHVIAFYSSRQDKLLAGQTQLLELLDQTFRPQP